MLRLVLHDTACEISRFKELLHAGKHEDTQSPFLTLSFHLSHDLEKYMIGAVSPSHGSAVSPPFKTFKHQVSLIFQEYKL